MGDTIKQRLCRYNGTDYDSIYLSANMGDVTGTLVVGNGGTGYTTGAGAVYNLTNLCSALTSSGLATGDYFPILDTSATTGKKITLANLTTYISNNIDKGSTILVNITGTNAKTVSTVKAISGSTTKTLTELTAQQTYCGNLPSSGSWKIRLDFSDGTFKTQTFNLTGSDFYSVNVHNFVPAGYTEVDYIASNGNAYFRTNINVGTVRWEGEVYPTTLTSGYRYHICGAHIYYNSSGSALYTRGYTGITVDGWNWSNNYAINYNGSSKITANVWHTFTVSTFNGSSVISDGTTYASAGYVGTTGMTFSDGGNMYHSMFTSSVYTYNGATYNVASSLGGMEKNFVGRLRTIWCYNTDTSSGTSGVISLFIPTKRNSDSVYGMYNPWNGVFYTSAGSSAFTGGAFS